MYGVDKVIQYASDTERDLSVFTFCPFYYVATFLTPNLEPAGDQIYSLLYMVSLRVSNSDTPLQAERVCAALPHSEPADASSRNESHFDH